MKNKTVKTITIVIKTSGLFIRRKVWIFDVSESLANEIMEKYENDSQILRIDNVPSKYGTMTLMLNKANIENVTVE